MIRSLANLESDLYQKLYLIRRFEETVLEYFPKGVFFGTTHTYLGQEANAVGVLWHIQPEDVVFSNHRCHGHFLAYGGDPGALFAELMGKSSGVCGGRGGSQHLQWRNFYSNGIQGGIVPIATGMGLAARLQDSPGIAVAFLGDGTLGQGVVYEAFNLASLWQIPILYVVENNQIAQTTPSQQAIAGNIDTRFQAFGISTTLLDSSDVMTISQIAAPMIERVRAEKTPAALILHTYRFGPHSKGDDTRPAEEINQMRRAHDPIQIHGKRLQEEHKREIETAIDAIIQQAFQKALIEPFPAPAYGT